ncbi:MAG: hypothetical protein A3D18_02110 [Chlamydiae bacterium RIFCSPHIGHO2_02_FULL_49_29]|nr:MAG: hypothetical protein A3D18_02110 [Chlamydiae bacterium RIFCSPHIGHO2_02_FULL_49_29]
MAAPIYLDHNTATPPFAAALDAFREAQKSLFASSLSPHLAGQGQIPLINEALSEIYEMIGADQGFHFLFSSGGAEAIGELFYSLFFFRQDAPFGVATTACEEASVLLNLERLEKRGCPWVKVPLSSSGQLTPEALEKALTPQVGLLSFSLANPLTGVIHPFEELVQLCKKRGLLIHLDATAVLGKHLFCLKDLNVDFLTLDGARLGAPRGTGALFVKEGAPFTPLFLGREGVNLPGVAALRDALQELLGSFERINLETATLKGRFEKALQEKIPGCFPLFCESRRLSNTTAMAFGDVSSEALLFTLNEALLFASMGGGLFPKLSHQLVCAGVEPSLAKTALSFALSSRTTKEEIDRAASIIKEAVLKLRTLSSPLCSIP